MNRDHAIFVLGAVLALAHFLEELLVIRFPFDERLRQLLFVAVTAAAVVVYPRLKAWRGPVALVFGLGWAVSATLNHVVDLLSGRPSVGDASGVLEFVGGLLVIAQGSLLTRDELLARLGRNPPA